MGLDFGRFSGFSIPTVDVATYICLGGPVLSIAALCRCASSRITSKAVYAVSACFGVVVTWSTVVVYSVSYYAHSLELLSLISVSCLLS